MRALAFASAFFLFSPPSLASPEPAPDSDLPPPPPPPPGARTVLDPDTAPPTPVPTPTAPPSPSAPDSDTHEVAPIPVNLDELPVPSAHPPAPIDDNEKPDDSPPRRWYGWKLIIADGATLSFALAEEPTRILGQTAFTVAAPAIHIGHKRGLAALGSVGMRLGAPFVASRLVRSDDCDTCFPTGWFLGALAAAAVDDSLLAYTSPPEPEKTSTLSPGVAVARRGAFASLAGTF